MDLLLSISINFNWSNRGQETLSQENCPSEKRLDNSSHTNVFVSVFTHINKEIIKKC